MTEGTRPFLPLERRARAAIICFWVFIAAAALLGLGHVAALSQGMNLYNDEDLEFEGAGGTAAVLLLAIGGGVFLIDILICIVVFLMWLYRARANLPALGVSDARWSPGWAIGWWFVPIMSLFRPYQLVKEVWQASDPATSPGWRRDVPPAFFGWWWGLFLVYWIAGRFTERYPRIAAEQPTLETAAWLTAVDVVALLAGIGAAWCAIQIMRDITQRQRQRYQVGAFWARPARRRPGRRGYGVVVVLPETLFDIDPDETEMPLVPPLVWLTLMPLELVVVPLVVIWPLA